MKKFFQKIKEDRTAWFLMYLVLLGSENVLIWLRSAMSQIIMRGRIVGKCFRESESLNAFLGAGEKHFSSV